MLEEMEKAFRERPRDADVIDLLRKLFSEGPRLAIANCRTARPDPLARSRLFMMTRLIP